MPASTYLGNMLLNSMVRGVAFTAPARVWVSLHTADPVLVGSNEVTTGAWPSYLRKDPAAAGAVATGFSAASAKATANLLDLLFAVNDGASPLVFTHFGLWDALTTGNFLDGGQLRNPVTLVVGSKTVAVGDEVIIKAGALVLLVA